MTLENKVSEILNNNHNFISKIIISKFNSEEDIIYTYIPRDLFNSPISFVENECYNIINSSSGNINLFKVVFEKLIVNDDNIECKFSVQNNNSFGNVRSEIRQNVSKEAVYSDFVRTAVVNILDISRSGARIESNEKILSDYIELFFDENNTPKQALGRVLWQRFNEKNGTYMYGLKLDFKDD